jgi:hypothetical protein
MSSFIRCVSAIALGASLVLTGCSSRVPQGISQAAIAHPHPTPVTVTATTAGYAGLVKDEEFLKAIVESIENTKVFSAVSPDAKVSLQVVLQTWQSDAFGIGMDGASTSLWAVTANGKTYTQTIAGKASKGFTDAIMGENRSRLAAKAALEDGIKNGIEWMGSLDLQAQ